MFKKPVISKEAEVLLKLLRIALGNETDYTLPKDVDWKEVVRLSYEHKVSALAVDGLQMAGVDLCESLSEERATELKSALVPWFKDVENTEWSYCYYVEVLKTLCQIFKDNGLTPVILKGYVLSLNYPRPSHRGAGDIDIYLLDENGNCAAEKGDEIIKNVLGVQIQPGNLHSHFTFKGIEVENHYKLAAISCFGEDIEAVDRRMKACIADKPLPLSNLQCAYSPSQNFNMLHLLRHMYAHFRPDKISLRQYCDLMQWMRSNQDKIDWKYINNFYEFARLQDFAKGVFSVLCKYFGYSPYLIPAFDEDNSAAVFFINDSFYDNKYIGIRNIGRYYERRWKIRYCHDGNWITNTIKQGCMYILRKLVH